MKQRWTSAHNGDVIRRLWGALPSMLCSQAFCSPHEYWRGSAGRCNVMWLKRSAASVRGQRERENEMQLHDRRESVFRGKEDRNKTEGGEVICWMEGWDLNTIGWFYFCIIKQILARNCNRKNPIIIKCTSNCQQANGQATMQHYFNSVIHNVSYFICRAAHKW